MYKTLYYALYLIKIDIKCQCFFCYKNRQKTLRFMTWNYSVENNNLSSHFLLLVR